MAPQPAHPAAIQTALKLGTALNEHGAPSHRIESALSTCARRLGVEAQFFSLPTSLYASFGPPGHQTTILSRTQPGNENLGRLARLDGILVRLERGELDPQMADREIDAVLSSPNRYGALWTVGSMGVATAGAARFFGGGWREMVVAGLIGMVAALLSLIPTRNPSFSRIFPATAAMCGGVIATLLASALTPMTPLIAMLAGLIVLIPGLSLTVAMTEVATGHLAAGTSRLTGALLNFVVIGFGVTLGSKIGAALVGSAIAATIPETLPAWTIFPVLLTTPIAIGVLMQACPRDLPWILLSCLAGYFGARIGTDLLGPELGVLVGAFMVAAGSNLYARHLDRPAGVPTVPGILLLVPGSIGFRSVAALVEQDVERGLQAGFAMVLVATALVTGLLVAQVLVPPRRSL